MFIKENDSSFKLIFDLNGVRDRLQNTIDSGVYNLNTEETFNGMKYIFERIDVYKNTIMINSGVFKKVNEYIEDFLSPSMIQARRHMGLINKLGLLFRGETGTGKTFFAGQLAQKLADKHNAVAIITTEFFNIDFTKVIDEIRTLDKERLVVVIFDEFEKNRNGNFFNSSKLLSFLDGSDSKDNVIILTLVNSSDDFSKLLLDRPGRYEKIFDFEINDDIIIKDTAKNLTPEKYRDMIDFNSLVFRIKKGFGDKNITVDKIKVYVRNTIAEIIHVQETGLFKRFNNI